MAKGLQEEAQGSELSTTGEGEPVSMACRWNTSRQCERAVGWGVGLTPGGGKACGKLSSQLAPSQGLRFCCTLTVRDLVIVALSGALASLSVHGDDMRTCLIS